MSYNCCCTRKINHEDQREMLATDKLCLTLLSLLIHLIKIMPFHAIYIYFIQHFLFVFLMVLFSKRQVSRGASHRHLVHSGDLVQVKANPELNTQSFTDVTVRIFRLIVMVSTVTFLQPLLTHKIIKTIEFVSLSYQIETHKIYLFCC